MFKKSLTYFVGSGLLLGGITSCYQKKAPKTEQIVNFEEHELEDDSTESDTLHYVDTFELVKTETIFKGIQNNAKQKTVYKLPVLKHIDSLKQHEFVEQIAVTNIYASIGKLSNNTKLFNASISENEGLFQKIIEDSLDFPNKPTLDSLNKWTELAISEFTGQHEWVYYEAIQWLEHLYLTIENPKNIKNQKKLEELVELQLENGTEMLGRLSAYQDYEPIAVFANYIITILDCKYYAFDVTQLKELVIDTRNKIYISQDQVNK